MQLARTPSLVGLLVGSLVGFLVSHVLALKYVVDVDEASRTFSPTTSFLVPDKDFLLLVRASHNSAADVVAVSGPGDCMPIASTDLHSKETRSVVSVTRFRWVAKILALSFPCAAYNTTTIDRVSFKHAK